MTTWRGERNAAEDVSLVMQSYWLGPAVQASTLYWLPAGCVFANAGRSYYSAECDRINADLGCTLCKGWGHSWNQSRGGIHTGQRTAMNVAAASVGEMALTLLPSMAENSSCVCWFISKLHCSVEETSKLCERGNMLLRCFYHIFSLSENCPPLHECESTWSST